MSPPITITYELVGAGWSTCIVEAGEQQVKLSASYLSDALGNLVLFALAVASGFHSASFGFDEEPGEYRWVAEATGANLTRLRVFEFQELWGRKPNKDGRLLLEVELKPLDLAEAVSTAADSVFERYGLKGYAERWAEHPFPERELGLLKSTVQAWHQ